MNPEGGVKLEKISTGKNVHQTKTISKLSICLKPENDLPHPRHLCFLYPFGKSSPKRHCIKCYCYVCEELAPCKKWKKPPKRHCDATEKVDKWKFEKQLKKKLHGITTMNFHRLTVCASYHPPAGPNALLRAFGGGLISSNHKEWVIGISMRLQNNVVNTDHDCSVPFYITLVEGLELAWSRGFRYLEVNLGFVFHDTFWSDFTKDVVTKKFRLSVTPFSVMNQRLLAILEAVEDYLNREWFIDVKNTLSFEEEAGAFTVALMADCQDEAKKVHDFRKHLCSNAHIISSEIKEVACEITRYVFDRYAYDASAEEKKYFGLN